MKNQLDIEYEGLNVKRIELDGKDIARHSTGLTLRLRVGEVPRATIDVIPLNGYVHLDECETEIVPRVVDATVRREQRAEPETLTPRRRELRVEITRDATNQLRPDGARTARGEVNGAKIRRKVEKAAAIPGEVLCFLRCAPPACLALVLACLALVVGTATGPGTAAAISFIVSVVAFSVAIGAMLADRRAGRI